jgi:hypothetical protein
VSDQAKAHTAFKFVAKTKRSSVILRLIMDDTLDNAFQNFSEEFERRRSIKIEQELAVQAMFVLRRLLTKRPKLD